MTPDETRERLVRSAAKVFAACGYEGATVSGIAKEAGLSSGAIYAHYRSKAELLVAAIRSHSRDELSQLMGGDRAPSLEQLIRAQGTALNTRSRRSGGLLAEAVVAARRDPDLAEALVADVVEREQLFVDLLRHAQDVGDLDPDVSAEVIARFCMMLGLGSLLVRGLGLSPTDNDDWSELIARMVRGVTSPPSPARSTARKGA